MESNRYDGLYRYVLELRAPIIPETLTHRPGAASWQGIARAPQYTASKHGVLGLMRALDPVAAEANIRLGVIHPWFAGALAELYAVSILIFSERYVDPWAPREAHARRPSTDARPTHSGCRLPRSDGPGPCDEWVSMGVTR